MMKIIKRPKSQVRVISLQNSSHHSNPWKLWVIVANMDAQQERKTKGLFILCHAMKLSLPPLKYVIGN
jgi:hypothetical protein